MKISKKTASAYVVHHAVGPVYRNKFGDYLIIVTDGDNHFVRVSLSENCVGDSWATMNDLDKDNQFDVQVTAELLVTEEETCQD